MRIRGEGGRLGAELETVLKGLDLKQESVYDPHSIVRLLGFRRTV